MAMTPQMLARFMEENFDGVEFDDALSKLTAFLDSQPKKFASKAAEKLYEELGRPTGIVATGRAGAIGIDDVRAAAGVETKRKAPSEFSHHTAQKKAIEAGLSASDFPDSKRSGTGTQTPLASGCAKRITIADVRRMMIEKGLADQDDVNSLFTSPGVAKAARAAGLSPSDFAVRGSISKADVDEMKARRMAKVEEKNDFEEIEEEDDLI